MNIIKKLTEDFPSHVFVIENNLLMIDGVKATVQYTNGIPNKVIENIGETEILNKAEENLYALLKKGVSEDIERKKK